MPEVNKHQPPISTHAPSENSSRAKTIPTSPHPQRDFAHQKGATTAPFSSAKYQNPPFRTLIYDLSDFFCGFSAGKLPPSTTPAPCRLARFGSRSSASRLLFLCSGRIRSMLQSTRPSPPSLKSRPVLSTPKKRFVHHPLFGCLISRVFPRDPLSNQPLSSSTSALLPHPKPALIRPELFRNIICNPSSKMPARVMTRRSPSRLLRRAR